MASGNGGVITGNEDIPDYWILLDGGWQLNCDQKNYPSKHDDAGKWFNPKVANEDCELIATSPSYVMRIKAADMQGMLSKGFAFKTHLNIGSSYYQTIFSN
ncbi:hypothetical protein P4S72_15105 [Vibrio sp. PP-XX7]